MKQTESQLQADSVQWFNAQYPHYKNLLIAIPNGAMLGGKNKYALMTMLKKTGLKVGTPDLFLAMPNGSAGGLWIEMKTPSGVVSDNQEIMQKQLWEAGYSVEVARSVDEFISIVKDYLGSR